MEPQIDISWHNDIQWKGSRSIDMYMHIAKDNSAFYIDSIINICIPDVEAREHQSKWKDEVTIRQT